MAAALCSPSKSDYVSLRFELGEAFQFDTVLLETVFLASRLLCGQRRRCHAGDRAALCRESGDPGKTAQGPTARLTPSWPTAQEGECAGECSMRFCRRSNPWHQKRPTNALKYIGCPKWRHHVTKISTKCHHSPAWRRGLQGGRGISGRMPPEYAGHYCFGLTPLRLCLDPPPPAPDNTQPCRVSCQGLWGM